MVPDFSKLCRFCDIYVCKTDGRSFLLSFNSGCDRMVLRLDSEGRCMVWTLNYTVLFEEATAL